MAAVRPTKPDTGVDGNYILALGAAVGPAVADELLDMHARIDGVRDAFRQLLDDLQTATARIAELEEQATRP